MENQQSSKEFEEKSSKMTLRGYYYNLPPRSAPRHNFLSKLVERCKVTEQTARNWVLYGIKPQQQAHVNVLCELTGLTEEQLWSD